MKAMKSLLALSVLAAAGGANAATVGTYSVTNTGSISGLTTGTINETGTAVLDDSGSLTVLMSGVTNTAAAGSFTLQSTSVFTGTFSGGVLTITGGTRTNTACQAGTSTCSANLNLGVATPMTATPATGDGGGLPLTAVSGGISYDNLFVAADASNPLLTRVWAQNHALSTINRMTFTNTTPPPAVPVPAAAWLFGTGLFGLIGAARRRRATAA